MEVGVSQRKRRLESTATLALSEPHCRLSGELVPRLLRAPGVFAHRSDVVLGKGFQRARQPDGTLSPCCPSPWDNDTTFTPKGPPGLAAPVPGASSSLEGRGQEDPRPTPTNGDGRGWGPKGRGRALQTPKWTAASTTPGAGAAWPCQEDPSCHGAPTRTRRPDALLETIRAERLGPQSTPRELSLAGPVLFHRSPGSYTWWGGTCPPSPGQSIPDSQPLTLLSLRLPCPPPFLRAKVQAGRITGETEPTGPPPHPGPAHPTPQRSGTQAVPGLGGDPRQDPVLGSEGTLKQAETRQRQRGGRGGGRGGAWGSGGGGANHEIGEVQTHAGATEAFPEGGKSGRPNFA